MAESRCPKCTSSSFEVEIESPENSKFKYSFIRCASCKTVVGVSEAYYNSDILIKLCKAIKDIADQLGVYVDLNI